MDSRSYQDAQAFALSWGGVYFLIMFAVALAYAMWPSNRRRFEEAAHIPLEDDGDV